MAVMDEFKEERDALKKGSFKQKISYFWTYYKWYVVITLAVIAFIISFVYELMNRKDDAFYGVFLNSVAMDGSADFIQGFADKLEIDTEEYNVSIDSSLYLDRDSIDENTIASTQKLAVYIASAQIDVIASDADSLTQQAYNETLYNLYDILSEEQIAEYEPYFYYIDRKVVEDKNENAYTDDYELVYPDPSRPEDMADPIPVGIYIDAATGLSGAYSFRDETIVIGIVINTTRPEESVSFIEYIFDIQNQ